MKKFKRYLLLGACGLLLLSSNTVNAKVKKPKLSSKSISILVGKSKTLKVKNTKKKIKWSTSNKKIATVSKKGKVVAKKKGTCKVIAKVGGKTLVCKVKVSTKKTNASSTKKQEPETKNNTTTEEKKKDSKEKTTEKQITEQKTTEAETKNEVTNPSEDEEIQRIMKKNADELTAAEVNYLREHWADTEEGRYRYYELKMSSDILKSLETNYGTENLSDLDKLSYAVYWIKNHSYYTGYSCMSCTIIACMAEKMGYKCLIMGCGTKDENGNSTNDYSHYYTHNSAAPWLMGHVECVVFLDSSHFVWIGSQGSKSIKVNETDFSRKWYGYINPNSDEAHIREQNGTWNCPDVNYIPYNIHSIDDEELPLKDYSCMRDLVQGTFGCEISQLGSVFSYPFTVK